MKGQKGITLVALIITIIVMLILVGVSISVALNGGLFEKARNAKTQTQAATVEEAMTLAKAEILAKYYDGTLTAFPPANSGEGNVQDLVNSYLDQKSQVTVTSSATGKYTVTPPAGTTLTSSVIDVSSLEFAPSGT